jgi:hypothetical protein
MDEASNSGKKAATFEEYLRTYTTLAELTRKETYTRYPIETDMLFEVVDNWPDLVKASKETLFEATNSISGTILINLWRLTNWISFDILSGKYFEAVRNLRFVFEGSVYAVIIENAIEVAVFERCGTLSSLALKTEIFELWENCKRKKVYAKGQADAERVKELVTNYVTTKIEHARKDQSSEYIQIYTQILCDERLYLPTSRMIEACAAFLRLDAPDIENLRNLWHGLSKYQHFSYAYLEAVADDPELCLMEKLNDELLKRSLAFYFDTLDFFYAVLAWRFNFLRKSMKEMCEWWSNNFKRTFGATEKTLARISD